MIPETLSNPEFMKYLAKSNNQELFDTEIVQVILNFKWNKYARWFHIKRFFAFLVFFMILTIDIYFFVV